jgi:hypothetical protein
VAKRYPASATDLAEYGLSGDGDFAMAGRRRPASYRVGLN